VESRKLFSSKRTVWEEREGLHNDVDLRRPVHLYDEKWTHGFTGPEICYSSLKPRRVATGDRTCLGAGQTQFQKSFLSGCWTIQAQFTNGINLMLKYTGSPAGSLQSGRGPTGK